MHARCGGDVGWAAFGAIVAVFQWGWGSDTLGAGAAGPVDAIALVMLIAMGYPGRATTAPPRPTRPRVTRPGRRAYFTARPAVRISSRILYP
ncbi:hypothetical protein BJY27_008406 [Streptomyces rapamycinicus]|uniref:Membrane protein n=2 Tax=Streptomyces rapamycinicus TaxID=1226757 RepID=A0A3L8QWK1_STRRN|nr:hypothetical protein [Streptomyces rapamycinicus]RLV71705.1 membrane protein [Streptomyces rapamycinicus NRRL 5491]